MDAKLGKQPLHSRFIKNQYLKHTSNNSLFLQILNVLPGGYEVEVFIAINEEYEGARSTNLPKLHVHNNFEGITEDKATRAKILKRLYKK